MAEYPSYALKFGLGQVTPMRAEEVVDEIVKNSRSTTDKPTVIANLNLHGLYYQEQDEDFRRFNDNADLVIIDGWPVLKLVNKKAKLNSEYRVGSTDWLDLILKSEHALNVVAIGGSSIVSSRMAAVAKAKNSNLRWIGFDGYSFEDSSGNGLVLAEEVESADLVLVGLGMPLQEQWIEANLSSITGVVANVGGCFDYYTGAQKLAPRWMGKFGIEWLYRFTKSPRRLFSRYFVEPFLLFGLIVTRKLRSNRKRSSAAK